MASFPAVMPLGLVHLHPHHQAQFYYPTQVGFIAHFPTLIIPGPAVMLAAVDKRVSKSLPCPHHCMADEKWGQLSHLWGWLTCPH